MNKYHSLHRSGRVDARAASRRPPLKRHASLDGVTKINACGAEASSAAARIMRPAFVQAFAASSDDTRVSISKSPDISFHA